jgi:hypothetical protein
MDFCGIAKITDNKLYEEHKVINDIVTPTTTYLMENFFYVMSLKRDLWVNVER